MSLIKFDIEDNFLKRVLVDYIGLWKSYFKNLNNYLIWLTVIFIIIALPFYIVYLILYGIFFVCNFAQNGIDEPPGGPLGILLIILQLILLIPSYVFSFVYFPAFFIGGIITIITIPCEKIKNHLVR